jgi:hypothetical protein
MTTKDEHDNPILVTGAAGAAAATLAVSPMTARGTSCTGWRSKLCTDVRPLVLQGRGWRRAYGRAVRHFRVIVIDIQTIRNGKIAKTYPVQNWLNALNQ